jgi:agmatinase
MQKFDPNGPAAKSSGVFGLMSPKIESKLVLLPVPWDATTSKRQGTSYAPAMILHESKFVELFDIDFKKMYEHGIFMLPEQKKIREMNLLTKKMISTTKLDDDGNKTTKSARGKINTMCNKANDFIYVETKKLLSTGKLVGVIGGDHSITLGSIKAHLEKYPKMALIQIDAHADLRKSFEGHTYSHASIAYNVLNETKIQKVIQVGVRALCEEEMKRIDSQKKRVETFFAQKIMEQEFSGRKWHSTCKKIASSLPKEVYISLDVDALDVEYCPNTGTPVPGGMGFQQLIHLIKIICNSNKRICGFDIVETGSNSFDASVSAHLLYQLCGWCLCSNTQ